MDQPVDRGISTYVRGARILLALVGMAVARHVSPAPAAELEPAERDAIAGAHALVQAGKSDAGFAVLDSLLAVAAAHGDSALRLAVLTTKGGHLSWSGEARAAEPLLTEAVALAVAERDSVLYARAAMWLGNALLNLGRYDEARSLFERALSTAMRIADREREGFIRLGLAYVDLMDGRFDAARRGYEQALALLRAAGNRFGELDALTGLGRAHDQLGDPDRAHACYIQVATLARRHEWKENEVEALNNLGTNEFYRGDPAAALRYLREALAIARGLGNPYRVVTPSGNVARALADLGRYDEAAAALDSTLALCREHGYADDEIELLSRLAELRVEQGDLGAAMAIYRDILARGDQVKPWRRIGVYAGAARVLAAQDSTAAALALLQGPARALRPAIPADFCMEHDLVEATVLLAAHRDEEALRLALAASAEAAALRRLDDRVDALAVAGRAALRLGRPEEAWRHLELGAEQWESMRARLSEPEWRERRAGGQALYATMIELLLAFPAGTPAPERTRAAFEAAQRFKARTLLERMRGPRAASAPAPPAVALAALEEHVLREREVLLDYFVGEESSFLFVVSRRGTTVVPLPGAAELTARIHLFRDLLATPPGDGGARAAASVAAVAREIAALVLGPMASPLGDAGTILLSPDGPLYDLPFDALLLVSGPAGREPADLRRVIARVPSAAVLAQIRTRIAGGDVPPARFSGLAVAGGGREQGESVLLPGAQAEVQGLARYAGIHTGSASARTTRDAAARELAAYDLLHFAAHTELNAEIPWRSAVVIGPAGGEDEPWHLHADEMAALSLRARLVVLSACESAGGTVLYGEGLQGLSSAFLAAGVSSVVATLWPVDDRATALFMRHFYAALSRGMPAGTALGAARREIAARPEYGAPFYWAGFVLSGEPQVTLPLERKAWLAHILAAALAAVCVTVLWFRMSRRRAKVEQVQVDV
jgi:tetratricopeptide (TPR) repeat protein